MHRALFLAATLAVLHAGVAQVCADPQLNSWYTDNSGKYARIFTTTANETAGASVTTWSRGAGVQTSPTYAGVNEISYSASWVYIRTTGLASHLMGPWYLDTNNTPFPNYPSNTATIYRIPRAPSIPASKTLTGNGPIGYFVNGVAFFDNRDAFSYVSASGTDATPQNHLTGDGIWNRNAYANELVTFDAALAHQAGKQYHYHVQPIALRYQLGDHVTYNATTNRYAESTAAVTTHSPIVAWAADGLPVYGPYGYASPLDASGGVRRMISGFVARDGTHNTKNLNTDNRVTLPQWAATVQGRNKDLTSGFGPNVSTAYALGHYLEDYDFLGDVDPTATYDLNVYNARYCVTPEFPGGTWAYFSTIDASGTPAFPYNIGRQFYGSPTGGAVTSITETVTTYFSGGGNMPLDFTGISRNSGTGTTTVSWSSVDGGTYKVEATPDFSSYSSLTTALASGGTTTTYTETPATTQRFYKVTRTALATYDNTGYGSNAAVAGSSLAPSFSALTQTKTSSDSDVVNFTVALAPNSWPPVPPAEVPLRNVWLGQIRAASFTRVDRFNIAGTLRLPPGAARLPQHATIHFGPPPGQTSILTYTARASFGEAR